ncbi:transcriptional regulator PpsR [Prosthecomicrobium sp. N25]|uniref:transcriptional regulator PpsR n=1 Tax=Prosthecomicrobium sp. N25 TaxID=3129254 RepID=UPI003078928D
MEAAVSKSRTGRFASPDAWLAQLAPTAAADLIAASADLAFFLDSSGVIRDVAIGSEDLAIEDVMGRPWVDIVAEDSRDKVTRLLDESRGGRVARWREVNLAQEGGDVPIRFIAMGIEGSGAIALGRDLRGLGRLQQKMVDLQRSVDRQYQRLRGAETRYRLLFQMSSEAVLIVDAGSRRIAEANGAAAILLGVPSNRMVGKSLEDLFSAASATLLEEAVASARAVGRADPARLRPASDQPEVVASFSAFRQDGGTYLLARLSPPDGSVAPDGVNRMVPGQALEILRGFPEAFVMIDLDRRIVEANESFLALAEVASLDQARGQRLDRWLGRPGVDVDLVVSNLKEHGAIRDFSTILRGEYGAQEEVEITAVAAPTGPVPCYSLLIRSLPEHRPISTPRESDLTRSVGQLTELVGRVSLKELVRETTDLVEQMCIQAALNLTGDNRASAAQILGLSRQGLYAKLRRYGIGDLGADDGAAD